MSELPEDASTNLSSKISRINVLKKLVEQDRVNLRAKGLGSPTEVQEINEAVREFLLELLYGELGGPSSKDPFLALGIEMTSEKALALDALLTRLTTPQRASSETSPAAPAAMAPPRPAPVVAPDGKRILSPVAEALRKAAGGDDAWAKLTPEERAQRVKEAERQARITYTSTT